MSKIKLLVEIDEEDYKAICSDKGYSYANTMWWIIRNGAPYNPSGDAISREALKEAIKDNGYSHYFEIFDIIDNAPPVPQVTVFAENADEKAVADMKAELQNIIEARPSGDCISRNDLKKAFDRECTGDCSICEHSRFDNFKGIYHCTLIDSAQAVPLPNEQTAWEQGYEAGLAQGKHESKKGEWIECRSSDHWKCDKCGHPAPLESRDCEWLSNFCPNCGADMRKGDTE